MTGAARVGRLHVITDETLQSRFGHRELARLAAEAGADVVQLREKRPRPTAELARLAREIHEDLAPRGVALIVDDRADVAAAARAEGVHLGRQDLDLATARRIVGPGRLIGRTVNGPEDLAPVGAELADYLGVGPVFGTRSKEDPAPALGLTGLRRIARSTDCPVVAVGNVTADRLAEILDAGAWGVAVLSAVACSRDPGEAVRRLAEALERAGRGAAR
jgi:thiamine-phosphate pyrophosphorylase